MLGDGERNRTTKALDTEGTIGIGVKHLHERRRGTRLGKLKEHAVADSIAALGRC